VTEPEVTCSSLSIPTHFGLSAKCHAADQPLWASVSPSAVEDIPVALCGWADEWIMLAKAPGAL